MKKSLVSVIVMTYKKFEYLEDNIKSIANQNYKNIELIISDDCSSNFDKEKINEIVIQYKNRFKEIIIQSNKENVGTVKNFNNAIKISNGEFIVPLSVDDYFANDDSVFKIVNYFNENKEVDICTAKRKILGVNVDGILPTEKQIKLIHGEKSKLLNSLCRGNFISGACTYYRRIIFDKLGFFDEEFRLMEDYPYYLKYLASNRELGFLNYTTIMYRDGGVSSLGSLNPIYINDWKLIYIKSIFNLKKEVTTITYRTSKLNYIRLFENENKVKYLINHFKYIDVVIYKAVNKINNYD